MKLKRILAITLRFGFLLKRNKTRLFSIIGWPIIDMLVWGFTTNYLNTVNKLNFSFTTVILGATILFMLVTRAQQGFVLPMFEDVWGKNFLNLFASPLKISEYVLGLILNSLIITAAVFIIIIGMVYMLFGYNIFQLGFMLAIFISILIIFGLSLGIFSVGLVLKLGASAEWLIWTIPFALAPFSSIYYPVSALPSIVQPIAKILPTTYAFEGMRNVLINNSFPLMNLIAGFLLSIFYFIIAYLFLIYIYKLVLKDGSLARFGVEN